MEKEDRYYCKNCNSKIEPTDTICPNCGKNLREVGRRVELFFTAAVTVSADVKVEKLEAKQRSLLEKIARKVQKAIGKELSQMSEMELDSVTVNIIPQLVSVTFKRKKEKTKE